MGAILLISGKDLDPDFLILGWDLRPATIHRKGEPFRKTKPEGEKRNTSTIIYDISNAEYSDLPAQIKETTAFLKDNKHYLEKLEMDKTIDSIAIDFSYNSRIDGLKIEVQHDSFPAQFIRIAGHLNIELRLTQWAYDSTE
ncbi:DUF4279 domain-containing protein [Desertivirga brevis]|uniref:DUF4279 domain-containing protein n=1 Tax=Desertivirga brevis TaxID=2810310 RepID=UPI001A962483|nr:DUF4279 domain-containing protein [Pedobacter sp. SYSU D00873]